MPVHQPIDDDTAAAAAQPGANTLLEAAAGTKWGHLNDVGDDLLALDRDGLGKQRFTVHVILVPLRPHEKLQGELLRRNLAHLLGSDANTQEVIVGP